MRCAVIGRGDLVYGTRPSAVATLVDCATRYTMVVALPDGHKADAVARALIEQTGCLPSHLRRSLTWDRGLGMAHHAAISAAAVDAGVLLRPAPPLAGSSTAKRRYASFLAQHPIQAPAS